MSFLPLSPALLGAAETRIPRLAQAWLAAQSGPRDQWQLRLEMAIGKQGRQRLIFSAQDQTGRRIAIKAHSARWRNRLEYNALVAMQRTVPDAVTPIYLARDYSYFAMEWLEGPFLPELLADAARIQALHHAGKWLAQLHRTAPKTRLRRAQSWMQLPRQRPSGTVGEAQSRLQQRLARQRPASGPQSLLHGDIHANNFVCSRGRLIAFDREENLQGLSYFDLGWFLVDIAQRRQKAAAQGAPWPGSAEGDRRAFFDGYGPIRDQHLALFDAVEDQYSFLKWRRANRKGQRHMDREMAARSLLGPAHDARPGRLVKAANGAVEWHNRAA